MFLQVNSVVLVIIGVALILGSKRLADFMVSFVPQSHMFTKPLWRRLLYVWPIRLIGLMCISFAIWIAASGPSGASLKSDKNRFTLLEHGATTIGQVNKVFYQQLAPSGWKVVYKFDADEPTTKEEKSYIGSSQGPKKYYAMLSKGDNITIIYDPCEPNLNCEIKRFLNNPSFRYTFKKAGKLGLLDKFKDKYKIEEYSFEEWYRQQQQR